MNKFEEIEINQRQKEFYNSKKKNGITKIWSYFRNGLLNKIRKNLGVEQQIINLHLSWFGDLSKMKVLDLGCYSGNALSVFLAQNSNIYVGIDLSDKGISILNKRLKNIPNAKAIPVDLLSEEFTEKDFDLVYAYGVLHHFRDTEVLIKKLKEKLKPNGRIISYDPLQTSIPINLIRKIYRPFQTDKDWEWPFSKKVYYQYHKAFKIQERRAVLGMAKWFFLIDFLPISKDYKERIGRKWHTADWEQSNISDQAMFSCMHITMLMQKKD